MESTANLPELPSPYLVFLGDATTLRDAKTGAGVAWWRPEAVVGEYGLPGPRVSLGLPELTPAEARARGARAVLVGIAPDGGQLPERWIAPLLAGLEAGLDIVSGLHTRLASIPEFAQCAAKFGTAVRDVRHSDWKPQVATGRKRTGRRLLTVGTDCALGKKYTALAIARRLRERGGDATFRATGQTGILIAGSGIAIDAVVADFISGAAEALSPDASPRHWDVIEGQGSLFHPLYAGVSLGLLHGSQPDAIVLCHDPSRATIDGLASYPLPSLVEAIDLNLRLGSRTNPAIRCVGVSLNTSSLDAAERHRVLAETGLQLGLPCIDPVAGSVDPIVDQLLP
jgi:uncharacterized NAD-dependent epimerase/dehydratase family protein